MEKTQISAAGIVQDYNRRGIAPDEQHQVNQGTLRLWLWNNQFIAELYLGSKDGQLVPGTYQICGQGTYRNTYSPQKIADNLAANNLNQN